MGGNDLYDLLHTKSRDRDKEIIENRSDKLIGMNEEKCIKYLEQKIEWFEENVLREEKEGKSEIVVNFDTSP